MEQPEKWHIMLEQVRSPTVGTDTPTAPPKEISIQITKRKEEEEREGLAFSALVMRPSSIGRHPHTRRLTVVYVYGK